mmetsp:Transcript_35258/g.90633  ORF Transcript_35258/g.90633 Transcript_35258/m.90633 type:complete len:282 (-) Transcript_35258:852-1697(-)
MAAIVDEHCERQRPPVHSTAIPPVLVGARVALAGDGAQLLVILGVALGVQAAPRRLELGVNGQVAPGRRAWRHALDVAVVTIPVAAGLGQEASGGQALVRDGVAVGLACLDLADGLLFRDDFLGGASLLDPDRLCALVGHAEALCGVMADARLRLPRDGGLDAGRAQDPLVLGDRRALLQADAIVVRVAVGAAAKGSLAARVHGRHVLCVLDWVRRSVASLGGGKVACTTILRLSREFAHRRRTAQELPVLLHAQIVLACLRQGARHLGALGRLPCFRGRR